MSDTDRWSIERLRPFLDYVAASSEAWEASGQLPREVLRRLAATGFLHERWGSGRRDGLEVALDALNLVAPLNGGVTLAVSLHSEVFLTALDHARRNDYARTVRLAALDGAAVGCIALTEHGGGSDPAAVQSVCVQQPDGTWVLKGQKRYISNADMATHHLVLAQATSHHNDGPTLFLVEAARAGVEIDGLYPKLGTCSVGTAGIRYENVSLPADAALGPIGGGMLIVLRCLRYERLAVSRSVLSGSRRALELALAFLRERPSGDGRLYDRCSLSHRLSECWLRLDAGEALLRSVVDRELSGAARDADFAGLKWFCARAAIDACDTAMQLFGGRGYTKNFPLERLWRDARLAQIGAGTDEMMLSIVSKALDRPNAAVERTLETLMRADAPTPLSDGVSP